MENQCKNSNWNARTMIDKFYGTNKPWLRSSHLHAMGVMVLIGSVLTVFYCHSLVASQIELAENDRDRFVKLLSLSKSIETRISDEQIRIADANKQLAAIESRIPQRLVDSEVLAFIHKTASESSIELIDLRPSSTKDISFETVTCKARSYQIRLDGPFSSVYQFLERVDNLPQKCNVQKCQIVHSDKKECQLHLELVIYFDLKWTDVKNAAAKQNAQ